MPSNRKSAYGPSNINKFFKRLTTIFRSGPAIQRRVKGHDPKAYYDSQVIQNNYGYKASAPFGFGRENSPFSVLGSYGLLDRISRYCITGDMLVATNKKEGHTSIQELSEIYEKNKNKKLEDQEVFYTFSFDPESNKLVLRKILNAFYTKEDEVVEVHFDNEAILKCTKDHRIMLRDGSYRQAQDLKADDAIMPFYRKKYDFITNYENNKVTKVIFTGKTEKVYDLTIEGTHNFAVIDPINLRPCGIIHNSEFSEMCTMPEIAAAIDTFSEEIVGGDDRGKCFHIFSENAEVKAALDDLFYDTVNVEFNLKLWARNVCKFGDMFLYCEVYPDIGIVNVTPIAVNEIEREEGFDSEDPAAIRFKWLTRGNKYLENWQIIHFRILGDDLFLPYGHCLSAGNYIAFSNGQKEIQHVKPGDMVLTLDQKTRKQVSTKVLDVVASGKKECFRVSTQHNFIDASKEHRIMLYDKNKYDFIYKQIGDLKSGDLMVLGHHHKTSKRKKINKKIPKDRIKAKFIWKNIALIPDYVNEDMAKLIGFLLGDGHYQRVRGRLNCVGFSMGVHDEDNQKYINLLENFSGRKAKIYKYGSKQYAFGSRTAMFHSAMLATILQRLGFVGTAHTKRVPSWIFSASNKIKKAFIEGFVDADGCLNTDRWNCERYSIEICNEELLKDLKIVIQSLGWKSGKIKKRTRFTDKIAGVELVSKNNSSYVLYFYKTQLKQEKSVLNKNDKILQNKNILIESILSIDSVGEKETYDIWIDHPDHNFYANGTVVHNSVLESSRRVWRQLCVSSATQIWVEGDGWKKVEEVQKDDVIYSFDYTTKNLVKAKVKSLTKQGEQKLVRVKTNHRTIDVTPNHDLLVQNKDGKLLYKKASDIVESRGVVGQTHRNADKLILPNTARLNSERVHQIKLNEKDYRVMLKKGQKIKLDRESLTKYKKIHKDRTNIYKFIQGKKGLSFSNFEILLKTNPEFKKYSYDFYMRKSHKKSFLGPDRTFTVTKDFMRLFGFMLGNGWVYRKVDRIGFALGPDEKQNNYYKNLFKILFNKSLRDSKNVGKKYSSGQTNCSSMELISLFEKAGFISGFANKRIPGWVYSMPQNYQKDLILGLHEGAGYNNNTGTICLSGKNLLEDVKILCQMAGVPVSGEVKLNSLGDTKFSKFFNKTVTTQNVYRLYIDKNFLINPELLQESKEDHVCEAVTHVEDLHTTGETYDIEVDHPIHNFVANGIVSHNTNMEDAMLTYRIVRCLQGDSKIYTKGGEVKIKDVKVGDEVYSFDTKTMGSTLSKVTGWVNNGKQQIWEIKTSTGRTLKTNFNHPILVRDRDSKGFEAFYVSTEKLIPSKHEVLIGLQGMMVEDSRAVASLAKERFITSETISEVKPTNEYEDVYDISVEDENHNFYANGMVVHNSPERRVFYIDVGNIPPNDVPNYMEAAKATLRSRGVMDRETGREDQRYGAMPIAHDTIIPLLDGRNIPIKQLAEEFEENNNNRKNKNNWVFSINDKTHDLVPGKVVWCGKNYTAQKMVHVELDDGSTIRTAPEHPFILRDGKQIRADKLEENMSLMPFYRTLSSTIYGKNKLNKYPMVYNPRTEEYEYAHKFIANDVWKEQKELLTETKLNAVHGENHYLIVHHKDFNKQNNAPDNLEWMGNVDHSKLHAALNKSGFEKLMEYVKTPENRKRVADNNIKLGLGKKLAANYNGTALHKEHNEIRKVAQLKSWQENKTNRSKAMQWSFPEECLEIVKEMVSQHPELGRRKLQKSLMANERFFNLFKESNLERRNINKFSEGGLKEILKRHGYEDGLNSLKQEVMGENYVKLTSRFANKEENLNRAKKNHKVKSVKFVDEECDVYCMTVEGPNGENDRHNFATVTTQKLNSKASRNAVQGGVIITNSPLDDYFIPVRGNAQGTKIDTLSGGQNTTAIEDVEYLQNKLFASLKVPKPYLNFMETLGAKASLAQMDVRFSRTIQGLQKIMIAELNKLAMIHLFAKGFDGEDLLDFELKLSNPSSVAAQQKLELWAVKFDIAGTAKETKLVDEKWVKKNILELTDGDIDLIEKGLVTDKVRELSAEAMELKDPEEPPQPSKTVNPFDTTNYELFGKDQPPKPFGATLEQDSDNAEVVAVASFDTSTASTYPETDEDRERKMPIKATPFLTKHKRNRIRRLGVGKGRSNMAMPDQRAMLSPRNKYTRDIHGQRTEALDLSSLKASLLMEIQETEGQPEGNNKNIDDDLLKGISTTPRLNKEIRSVFKNMEKSSKQDFGATRKKTSGGLLTEQEERNKKGNLPLLEEEDIEIEIMAEERPEEAEKETMETLDLLLTEASHPNHQMTIEESLVNPEDIIQELVVKSEEQAINEEELAGIEEKTLKDVFNKDS
jgi:intein/homing endonuclease